MTYDPNKHRTVTFMNFFDAPMAESEAQTAKRQLQETLKHGERMMSEAQNVGVVSFSGVDYLFVLVGPQRIRVPRPAGPLGAECTVGTVVTTTTKGQVICAIPDQVLNGEVYECVAVIDEGRAEVDVGIMKRVVTYGRHVPRVGDRVVLDMTGAVVVGIASHGKTQRFALSESTGVSWDDVAGLEDAKSALREAVEGATTHRELYKRYDHKPIRGILLYGPPGCGKTQLGRAAATALAKAHGSHASGFLYVKGPEILDRFVGASEAAIRELFDSARRHEREHGYPALIFLDEADSLLSRRESAGGGITSAVDKTIVPQFLAEMDGLDKSNALVIIATNRADVLDPAIVREGRVDRKVRISRPSEKTFRDIVRMNLGTKPTAEDADALAEFATSVVFSDASALAEVTLGDKIEVKTTFALRHVASGAMAAGLVRRATQAAIQQEVGNVECGTGDGLPLDGISRAHFRNAVAEVLKEARDADHSSDFAEFAKRQPVKAVRKIDP